MAIVEVDIINTQSLQRASACLLAVLRGRVDFSCSIIIGLIRKLSRKENGFSLFWILCQPFANKIFGIAIYIS